MASLNSWLSGLDSLLALLAEYRSLTFVWCVLNLTPSSMVCSLSSILSSTAVKTLDDSGAVLLAYTFSWVLIQRRFVANSVVTVHVKEN